MSKRSKQVPGLWCQVSEPSTWNLTPDTFWDRSLPVAVLTIFTDSSEPERFPVWAASLAKFSEDGVQHQGQEGK